MSKFPLRLTFRNATASLLNLGHGPLAVTCHHVLEEYRARIQQSNGITSAQARRITGDDEIGSSFFEPASWPPTPIREGDYVAFGGFPGEWRAAVGIDAMEFSSYSSGASQVTVARDSYFVSQFEREYWVSSFAHRDAADLSAAGGLSGGPAFALRGLHYDLVSIVYEFSTDYELLYFRHAGVIGADGRLS